MSNPWPILVIVYLVGALLALALQCGVRGPWARVSLREVGQILLLALLWPLVVTVAIGAMLVDLVRFIAAVIRRPH